MSSKLDVMHVTVHRGTSCLQPWHNITQFINHSCCLGLSKLQPPFTDHHHVTAVQLSIYSAATSDFSSSCQQRADLSQQLKSHMLATDWQVCVHRKQRSQTGVGPVYTG